MYLRVIVYMNLCANLYLCVSVLLCVYVCVNECEKSFYIVWESVCYCVFASDRGCFCVFGRTCVC